MSGPFRLAVFAHNEEQGICRALQSALDTLPAGSDVRVHVLINGCSDRTAEVVRAFAAGRSEVIPVEFALADKCNAWNTYVYELADDSPCHFFMDGDVTCSPGALLQLQEQLLRNDSAMAIAGLPMSGRHRETYQRYIREWHWLYGGLYGVKAVQLAKLRTAGLRLPLGLCANDHFISKLMATRSVDPTEVDWGQNIAGQDAGFCFPSLQPYRWQDWKIYWKRSVTYALRQLQIREMDDLPVTQLPSTMDAVNRRILAGMEGARLKVTDVFGRAVRRKLRRMYPTEASAYFDRLLTNSNHSCEMPHPAHTGVAAGARSPRNTPT